MGKYCSAPGSAVSAQTHCTASQGADGENRHRTHNGHKTCLPVSLPLHHCSCKDRGHLTFSNCPHLSTAGSAYTQSLSNPNFRLIFAPSSRIRMRTLIFHPEIWVLPLWTDYPSVGCLSHLGDPIFWIKNVKVVCMGHSLMVAISLKM